VNSALTVAFTENTTCDSMAQDSDDSPWHWHNCVILYSLASYLAPTRGLAAVVLHVQPHADTEGYRSPTRRSHQRHASAYASRHGSAELVSLVLALVLALVLLLLVPSPIPVLLLLLVLLARRVPLSGEEAGSTSLVQPSAERPPVEAPVALLDSESESEPARVQRPCTSVKPQACCVEARALPQPSQLLRRGDGCDHDRGLVRLVLLPQMVVALPSLLSCQCKLVLLPLHRQQDLLCAQCLSCGNTTAVTRSRVQQ
jgi:hypothetical protein